MKSCLSSGQNWPDENGSNGGNGSEDVKPGGGCGCGGGELSYNKTRREKLKFYLLVASAVFAFISVMRK
jgi:hypothetical protein